MPDSFSELVTTQTWPEGPEDYDLRALAFMLMGTFAFANTNDTNLEDSIVTNTEVTATTQAVSEVVTSQAMVQPQTDVIIIIFDDGTVIIIVRE